jgi:hypothetical protein
VLTLAEMKSSVVAIFRERKTMASSLEDTDSIVRSLQFGIGCAIHFFMSAMYLLVRGAPRARLRRRRRRGGVPG